MPVSRSVLILGALLAVHFNVSAGCHLNSQKIIAAPETVIMKKSAQSGSVLHSRTWSVQGMQAQDCKDTINFKAHVMGDKSAMILPGILRSNVSDIGIKVSLILSSGRIIQWPSEFTLAAGELKGSKVMIELVKIDGQRNKGGAPGNINLQIKSESQPMPVINIALPASYINILSRSCWINDAHSKQVRLPEAAIGKFTHQGSTAGMTRFEIKVSCKGNIDTVPHLATRWYGPFAENNSSNGILLNLKKGGAQGIGIQLLDGNNNPVNFDSNNRFIPERQGEGIYSIPLQARYYQYQKEIMPGGIASFVHFSIDYQ